MLVSVIIVNYNGGEFVLQCVDSVLKCSHHPIEVLVVDNSSTDGSVANIERRYQEDKRVKVIKNPENFGYAAAVNLAAATASGDYLAVLNNDTVPDVDWLNKPVQLMEEDLSVGAIQPILLFYDRPTVVNDAGHFIDKFGIVYSRNFLPSGDLAIESRDEIFAATGAAMIVRRTVFEDLTGFDSDFFLLFEETDFCWRVWLSGHRVLLDPRSRVYHKARASYRFNQKVGYLFNRNRICSMLKNYENRHAFKFVPANLLIIIATGLYMLSKSNSTVLLENMGAILWNVTHLKLTLQKKREFYRRKRTPQEHLFALGVIMSPRIPSILRKLQNLQ